MLRRHQADVRATVRNLGWVWPQSWGRNLKWSWRGGGRAGGRHQQTTLHASPPAGLVLASSSSWVPGGRAPDRANLCVSRAPDLWQRGGSRGAPSRPIHPPPAAHGQAGGGKQHRREFRLRTDGTGLPRANRHVCGESVGHLAGRWEGPRIGGRVERISIHSEKPELPACFHGNG